MREFYYRFISSGNAYGPVRAVDETAAKKRVRELWKEDFVGRRVRFELWETTPQDRESVQENYRKNYHSQYACE